MMAARKQNDSDTAVDPISHLDSTTARKQRAPSRDTQPSADPPTVLVRHDHVRELLVGTVVDDTYEIDSRLGSGAMGDVYAARHVKLGKRVAIKVIGKRLSQDADAIERFAMEARTLAQIQHPAIVAVDHVGELADGRAYFVMELLRGASLFERMQQGRLPLPEALRILDQMARGLEAAHAQGVTHRDLKPENTFLVHLPDEAPIVKLVDFGLAKLRADRADLDRRAERTQSGVAVGTPMYMSPEQARGSNVDHRTDIYALGCVAYELILGVSPFAHAQSIPALYAAHLHEVPTLPRAIWPEIPPQLDLALFAMLAKDAAYRPTLAQFRAVLANVRAPAPSQRVATQFVRPAAPRSGAQLFAMIAVALAVLMIVLVIGIELGSRKAAPATRPPTAQRPAPVQNPVSAHEAPATSAPNTPHAEVPSPAVKIMPVTLPAKPLEKHSRAKRELPTPIGTELVPPPVRSIDRNQTINPFEK